MPENSRRSIAENMELANRKTMGSWWIWGGGAYLAVVAYIAISYGTISSTLGIPRSLEALLLDVIVLAVLPMFLAFWLHIRKQNERARERRETFLSAHADDKLVTHKNMLAMVYKIVSEDAETTTVKAIWNADGAVLNGSEYEVNGDDLEVLDQTSFVD